MLVQPIETERLIIRRFEPADWQAVHAYASDADHMTYMGGALTEPQAREFVEQHAGAEGRAFPVMLKSERHLIGHMMFHPWFGPRTQEVGWVIHPAYQGRGYATEAARALLRYSFADLHSHRVIATCQPENPASYRIMEKLGMRREAHFVNALHQHDDVWWDEYLYAILAKEWFSRPENRPA